MVSNAPETTPQESSIRRLYGGYSLLRGGHRLLISRHATNWTLGPHLLTTSPQSELRLYLKTASA